MSKETKINITAARAQIVNAERELERAKAAHRQAFREALVALFNEYGLSLEADGCEGSRIEINDLNGVTYKIGDLPE